MTTQLSVRADAEAEAAGAVAAVVASLPVSLKPATAGADLVGVAGSGGWTGRAAEAIRRGAKGVVVVSPEPEDPTGLATIAAEHGAAVVLDQQWAGNPVFAEAQTGVRTVLTEALPDAVLVDSVAYAAPGSDTAALLTEHLAVILACGLDVGEWRRVQLTGHGYVVSGALPNGAPVALHGILTSAVPATAKVSVFTATGRADVVLPDPAAAWPAEIRAVTPDGATTLPSLYETSHRHAWRRLLDQISLHGPNRDLEQFNALAATVNQLNY